MRPTPESELEQWLDRELRALPPRRAPLDLVPGVLRAVEAFENRPWWQKPYAYWPMAARFAFLAVATGLGALALFYTWGLSTGATWSGLSGEVAELTERLSPLKSFGNALGSAAMAMGRAGGTWLLWGIGGVVAACYVTTLALGTMCYRVMARRA